MTNRLTLLCVPATAALRAGRFPAGTADDGLDSTQQDSVAALCPLPDAFDRVLCSPARCATDTARALGRLPDVDPVLREVDYGRWAGQSLKDIAEAEPEAASAWLADPDVAPHGGESLNAAIARVAAWAAHHDWSATHTLVVTHASVIRALLLHGLRMPAHAYRQFDIAPLTLTALSVGRDPWRVRSIGVPMAAR